jgi:hypothetical protein
MRLEDTMQNGLFILALLMTIGCNGATDDDTVDTDTDTDSDPDYHPLVPEEYRYLWNTEGCETDEGMGATVYRYATDAQSDGTTFSVTEQWFWFFPEDGWDADCVDTFTMTGDLANFDYGQLGCSGCEEAYSVKRTLTDSKCNMGYSTLFGYEEPEDITEFDAILMFDSFTPNETPNEDNKMLVIAGTKVQGNAYSMDIDYARGHAFGESEDYFPPGPATYDWVGNTCVKVN